MKHKNYKIYALLIVLITMLLPGMSDAAQLPLGTAQIRVLGMQVDVDTRPDIQGIQYTMTAVKDIPTGVMTLVGLPGVPSVPNLPGGSVVRAELAGPSFGNQSVTVTALPNQTMEIPTLGAAGDHYLYNVRLEDADGNIVLMRDPAQDIVVINVIDKLLVTQVTSRPLTIEEIQEKGIVIDEDNFTVMNFTVGLTVGSQQVVVDFPMLIPNPGQFQADIPSAPVQRVWLPPLEFEKINIPNLSLVGFTLQPPDEEIEGKEIQFPPINGVIIIPGNIAFLHQFFSVILQATNVAPAGSGLALQNAQASIALPTGDDAIKGSGDDPLRVAETRTGGVQEVLPLTDQSGSDTIVPQGTNNAEFLVEGLKEGTHNVTFDIKGDLFVPSLGKTVQMKGKAAGVVQVKNPTFSMVIAHPDVVRNGEEYPLFVTVTNTSVIPANLFQLRLNSRSLSGTRLAEGESELKTLDTLLPGQAETFEFRMVARTTGKVTGTVFLADEGINGSFVLNTGVGDTGIPLSPDTLILPQTVDYLPDEPDIVFAAVRLLGQAYSVATAPAGALPPEISRISKGYVFDRAVKLAQAGLHIRFGESALAAAEDILMDYLSNDVGRLDVLYPDEGSRAAVRRNAQAFDGLRRAADAGHDLSDVIGELIGDGLSNQSLSALQREWAGLFASRPAHLSFGVSSHGPPVYLKLSDSDGNRLGRLNSSEDMLRDLSFADRLPLIRTDTDHAEILFSAAPVSGAYTLEFSLPEGETTSDISLILPYGSRMAEVLYPQVSLSAGSYGKMLWNRDGANTYEFRIDLNGDGIFDQTLSPSSVTAVEDHPPALVGVLQWAKGNLPSEDMSFTTGDPLGRMVGVLFSEEVEKTSAVDRTHYRIPEHYVKEIMLQPDRRMVFLVTTEPIGPFVPRELSVLRVQDSRGLSLDFESRLIAPDPDRGVGGLVSGIVQGADGKPVPFAHIKYIQPVLKPSRGFDLGGIFDYVISTITADASGRYQLDFVLQDGHTAETPDVWLNENNVGGTDNFKLEAADPETGDIGKASTRLHFDGQKMTLNIIIRGYGGIEGSVYDEDGNLIIGDNPDSTGALFVYAKNISTGETFRTWVDSNGHYSFPRTYTNSKGDKYDVPQVTVGNVILQILRASDRYTGVVTTNIPAAGMIVHQDIVMIPPNRYGVVSGRVLESDGITGARNVLVQIAGKVLSHFDLYSRSYDFGLVGSTYTDESGQFHFDNVPAGDIELNAVRKATYEQARIKSYLHEEEDKPITIILPGSGNGTIRGYVRDALGNLIRGAKVAGGPTLTQTDAGGYFEINGLPMGRYTVYAQSPKSPALGTLPVDILIPNDVQTVIITLEPVGSIVGTVYEADGVTKIADQKVQLWVGDTGVIGEAFTDRNGHYEFINFPAKQYSIRAVKGNYGDGGMAFTSIRYAGDMRDADIVMRGLGQIKGRVIQSNGTPVVSDVVITRKVWRIITPGCGSVDDSNNYYLDYVGQLVEEIGGETGSKLGEVLAQNYTASSGGCFMLTDEPVLLSSNILGPDGEVTGRFQFTGPAAGGPFTVAAFGPFLAPAEKKGEIPRTADPAERIVDVGDIILEPTTGQVRGTVYMPDGVTPVGENVLVRIRSLDNSGSVYVTGVGNISQPVLPEYDVVTDTNGQFHFPLVLRGKFILTADTGVPASSIRAHNPAEMETERFSDENGERVLNVRLYGQTNGVVPAYEILNADIKLHDVAGIKVSVVENDGVTPVPYAEVTVRTESGLDTVEEAGFVRQIADENGIIEFFPLIEGKFSVSARNPDTPAKGQADGAIPVNPPNGLQIPVKVTLGAVTTSSGQVIAAAIFGSVEGIVYKADGTPLSNPAQVTVKASGVNLLTTSDSTGRYRVDYVPGGNFQVEVFEPFTARRGTNSGRINTEGQVVDVPVTLIGLGTVTGQVFNATGGMVIINADVVLYPSGRFSDRLISRTDAAGSYMLPGVPLGEYLVKATDYASGLTGEKRDRLDYDGDTKTTDVYLEASGMISGVVYGPGVYLDTLGNPLNGDGNPWPDAPVASNASVTISGSGYTQGVQTDANGVFVSGEFLRMGTYGITARPAVGNDGTSSSATLSYDGQTAHVSMVMKGYGAVEGFILDSIGENPVNVAQVTLHSRSPYSRGAVTRFTDINGRFQFEDIPAGEFSINVITTLQIPQLGAVASGRIERHGQAIIFADGDDDLTHNAIRLQESGQVTGTVMISDRVIPADGTVIEITGSGIRLAHISDSSGSFSFEGLPLGTYNISFHEAVTNGVAGRRVTISTNGELIDLGVINLDSSVPVVISTIPSGDTTGVEPTTAISAVFSEPVDTASINQQTFRVTVDNIPVEGSYSVSSTDPVVMFTPAIRLPDLKRINVMLKADRVGFEGQVIETGIRDLAGISLTSDFTFTFTTRDTTPPSVVSISPADVSEEVPLSAVIRIEFSEPVDRSSIQSFTLTRNGEPAAGAMNTLPIFGDKVFVFTPAALLLPNSVYTATLTGPVQDMARNTMSQSTIVTTFATIDTLAPVVQSLSYPSGTTLVQGKTISVAADVGSAADVAYVEFYLNGTLVNTDSQTPFSYDFYLAPELGAGATIGAVAADAAGNRSGQSTLPLTISANQPPMALITSPGNIPVSLGQTVTVRVGATDDVGVSRITYTANNGTVASGTKDITPATSTQATFTFTVPANYPMGSTILLRASASDTLGVVSPSNEITLTVEDFFAPSVAIGSPANNSAFDPGAEVSVFVRAGDSSGIREIRLNTQGAVVFSESRGIAPAVSPASATFVFRIPPGALPTQTVTATATAVDGAGNTTAYSIFLKINDRIPPVVSLSSSNGSLLVEPGRSASVQVTATDETGVTQTSLQAAGIYAETRAIASLTQTLQTFTFMVPADTPLGTAIAVDASAGDKAGNTGHAAPLTLTTADLTGPAVTITAPAAGSKVIPGNPLEIRVSATDHYGVSALSFQTEGAALGSGQQAVESAVSAAEAVFTLTVPANAATGSAITLQAGALDSTGNSGSAAPVSVTVADIIPPRVTGITPADGAVNVNPATPVTVTFDEPVAGETVHAGTMFLSDSEGIVSGSYAFSNGNLAVVFMPAVPLTYGKTYALTLTTGITDLSGNPLAAPKTSTFTVTPPVLTLSPSALNLRMGDSATLTLVSSTPAPAGGISVTLTATPAGVVSVTIPVLIPEGQTQATLTIAATALGTATLTAEATGFVAGQAQIRVASPKITGINPTSALQGTVIEAVITGELQGGASAISFTEGGLTGTIRPGGSETSVPVTLAIPADAPVGAYGFTLTLPSGELSSGTVRLSVGATFKGSTQTLSAPVSVFVPASGVGGMIGQGVGVSQAVSVFVPASGVGGMISQGVGVSPAVSVFVPASGLGGTIGQGVAVSLPVSVETIQ